MPDIIEEIPEDDRYPWEDGKALDDPCPLCGVAAPSRGVAPPTPPTIGVWPPATWETMLNRFRNDTSYKGI